MDLLKNPYFNVRMVRGSGREGRRTVASGFTLIELLVVITIIGILATLLAPSISGVFRGSQINQGGSLIQDQLTFFRQYALANNRTVEVRFYNYIDPNIPNDTGHFRAIQAFSVTQNSSTGTLSTTYTPISKALRLPPSVIIDQGTTMSYLIGHAPTTTAYGSNVGVSVLNVGTSYTYSAFQFRPDGSTNINQTATFQWYWCLTVHLLNPSLTNAGDSVALSKIPKDYYTIQIDPVNGHVSSYRP